MCRASSNAPSKRHSTKWTGRRRSTMWARLTVARRDGTRLVTHGGVVGQVWRRPARQARLALALRAMDVRPLDGTLGRNAGMLLAAAGTTDVIDAALVLLSRP